MKAVVMQAVGAAEVLQLSEWPDPIPAADEVVVAIRAAGVNPVDTKIRKRGLFYNRQPPAILGLDGAGEIVALGAEVTNWAVGDRVWFCSGGLGGAEQGSYATLKAIPAAALVRLPDAVDFITAAAAPLVLITAWEALFEQGQLQAGERVLIHGGAGGVGHVAIQLAKQAGAEVWTTVSSAEKAELATALGADGVIRYDQGSWVAALRQQVGTVDRVLEMHGGALFEQSQSVLTYRGRLVTLVDPGAVSWSEARNRNASISFELMLTPILAADTAALAQQRAILQQCGERMAAGSLRVILAGTRPLAEAAEVHRQVEAGHSMGKWVLVPEQRSG